MVGQDVWLSRALYLVFMSRKRKNKTKDYDHRNGALTAAKARELMLESFLSCRH